MATKKYLVNKTLNLKEEIGKFAFSRRDRHYHVGDIVTFRPPLGMATLTGIVAKDSSGKFGVCGAFSTPVEKISDLTKIIPARLVTREIIAHVKSHFTIEEVEIKRMTVDEMVSELSKQMGVIVEVSDVEDVFVVESDDNNPDSLFCE